MQKAPNGDPDNTSYDQYKLDLLGDFGADCKNQLAPVMSYTFPKPYS